MLPVKNTTPPARPGARADVTPAGSSAPVHAGPSTRFGTTPPLAPLKKSRNPLHGTKFGLTALRARIGLPSRSVPTAASGSIPSASVRFTTFVSRSPLLLNNDRFGRQLAFDMTHQILDPGQLAPELKLALAKADIPLHDAEAMRRHLDRLISADWCPPPSQNPYLSDQAYLDRHQELSDTWDRDDPAFIAIKNWTDPNNQYSQFVSSNLLTFRNTGRIDTFVSADYGTETGEEITEFDPIEQERLLSEALDAIPECPTHTVRISDAESASSVMPNGHLALAGRLLPGQFVSNYPLPMSTTSGGNLHKWDSTESESGECRLSEFIGHTGRPLLSLNDLVDDIESEVTYAPRSVFQLVATAHGKPLADGYAARSAALFVEVRGKDARTVPNLHSGDLPRYHLPEPDADPRFGTVTGPQPPAAPGPSNPTRA